jgi:hypothetical protein
MQVYQLYCAASIFTTLQRPNPSLVLNYTAMDTVLGIQGWLYDKNGKKPVKNLPGSPIDSPDPLFLLSADPYVSPFKVDPFRFQLLNISNKLYDSIVSEITAHGAQTIVFKPQ